MTWVDEADGVFRGGGVKGIGLAGALLGCAEHPTRPIRRWVDVAGASAGAIIACCLATGHDAAGLVELLRATDLSELLDPPPPGGAVGGARELLAHHGYARGERFEAWMGTAVGHRTFASVRKDAPELGWRLRLIAVDVTKQRLLVLPDDLAAFRDPATGAPIDPDAFPIARAARMSMAIPFVFAPVELTDLDGTTCTIIDGGTLSNFPVWLFDVDPADAGRPPARPTIGFTLTGGHGVLPDSRLLDALTPWPVDLALDIFRTAQDAWDKRFVSRSTRVRTITVDALDVGTTEFDLAPERRARLLAAGHAAATTFLDGFSLEEYRNSFHAGVEPPSPQ